MRVRVPVFVSCVRVRVSGVEQLTTSLVVGRGRKPGRGIPELMCFFFLLVVALGKEKKETREQVAADDRTCELVSAQTKGLGRTYSPSFVSESCWSAACRWWIPGRVKVGWGEASAGEGISHVLSQQRSKPQLGGCRS